CLHSTAPEDTLQITSLPRPRAASAGEPAAKPLDRALVSPGRAFNLPCSTARSSMKRQLRTLFGIVALAGLLGVYPAFTQVPDNPSEFPFGPGMRRMDPRIMEYQNISKGSKTYQGPFKLYHKGENLYAELLPQHMNKSLLCPIAIAKGAGLGGM